MPASGHFSGDLAAAEGDEDLLNQLSQELGLQQFANDAASYQVGKSIIPQNKNDNIHK